MRASGSDRGGLGLLHEVRPTPARGEVHLGRPTRRLLQRKEGMLLSPKARSASARRIYQLGNG